MGRTRKLRRSGSGGTSGEESVKFEAKPPEQNPGFDDLNETKYGKKQEKLSKLGLRAGELKEIEADPELAGLLDVQHPNPDLPSEPALHLTLRHRPNPRPPPNPAPPP
jgi:hypothetical protein